MFSFFKKQKYFWLNGLEDGAKEQFTEKLKKLIPKGRSPIVFLCIGTPLIPGDCLGPVIGSYLKLYGLKNVYGTLDEPVHAENIEKYRKIIENQYTRPTIVAIDASIGLKSQTGYITLRKGALKPGSAVGKKIQPIGHIEITGVFEDIEQASSKNLVLQLSGIITHGILKTQNIHGFKNFYTVYTQNIHI